VLGALYRWVTAARLRDESRVWLRRVHHLGEGTEKALLNSDPSGLGGYLGGYIVLLDGRTMLRNQYAALSDEQRKPSFKFGTSDEFGSIVLLLSNKDVQLARSQSLT
jgi:hypothetical protein